MGSVVTAVVVALAASIIIRYAQATKYVVGEGTCWQGAWDAYSDCDYNTWALDHDFAVGDTLVFNFEVGLNNVAEVTKLEYDGCTFSPPTHPISVYRKTPAPITLSHTGTFYFVSTASVLPGSCLSQRLAVTVNATSSESPSTVDSPPNTPLEDNHSVSTPISTTTTPAASSTSTSHESSSSSHSTMVKAVVGSLVGFMLFLAKIFIIVNCVQRRRRQRIRLNAQFEANHHTADPGYNAN